VEPNFVAFSKMARLTRECVITEKIDGTNAQIYIVHSLAPEEGVIAHKSLGNAGDLSMFTGSRTRFITPKDDNFGFARWAQEHAEELWALGPGRHFGEWWGKGIQRTYDLPEKRFSLFNTSLWVPQGYPLGDKQEYAPACCSVVPILYQGLFGPAHADKFIAKLRTEGSMAAPGYMNPEGIVIHHIAAGVSFKKTIKDDDSPKSTLITCSQGV